MARRYGRGQKRAARERERVLQKNLSCALLRANMAEHNYKEAENRAFARFAANADLINAIGDRMSRELARKLGDELYPVAERIWLDGTKQRYCQPFEVGVMPGPMEFTAQTYVMLVSIPAIEYRHVIEMA